MTIDNIWEPRPFLLKVVSTKSGWYSAKAGEKIIKRFAVPTRIEGIECRNKTQAPSLIVVGNIQVWPPAPWHEGQDVLTYPLSPGLDPSMTITLAFEKNATFRFLCSEVRR